jgi:uncharacterized protein (TIGR00730 family)
LIYGGASVGLMGAVANAALQAGGAVTGIIPGCLVHSEVAHRGLDELRIVGSMHERKALMAELADGFVALPGGIGTLDEMLEAWAWAELGHHVKPRVLYNVGGYFDRLVSFLDQVAMEGFLHPAHRKLLTIADDIEPIFEALVNDATPLVPKWLAQPVEVRPAQSVPTVTHQSQTMEF